MLLAFWIGFLLLILLLLALDLGVFHRTPRAIGIREAVAWTVVWVVLALGFNALVYLIYRENWFGADDRLTGGEAALQFFTGYLLEKSLSIDNIFVIAMIFAYFRVPLAQQHRVLFWGVLGAIVLRGIMIAVGGELIARFDWVVYIFGALLLATAVKVLVVHHDTLRPHRHPLLRLTRRLFPVAGDFHGSRFFVVVDGRRAATPLFLALVLVESCDVLFAIDSIPAIFAVTHDTFIVFTSNIFAILGLRSLYFALAGLLHRFRYLKAGLAFILAYVGIKMMLAHHQPIPTPVSLAVIAGILAVAIAASLVVPDREPDRLVSPPGEDGPEPPGA